MKILIVDIFKKYRLSTNLPNSNSPLHYPPRFWYLPLIIKYPGRSWQSLQPSPPFTNSTVHKRASRKGQGGIEISSDVGEATHHHHHARRAISSAVRVSVKRGNRGKFRENPRTWSPSIVDSLVTSLTSPDTMCPEFVTASAITRDTLLSLRPRYAAALPLEENW